MRRKSYRPWLYMLLMLIICLAPFVAANYFYRHHNQIHFARHYHGQLYRNMPQLSSAQLIDSSGVGFTLKHMRGQWLLMYVSPGCCTTQLCRHNIYNLRAMRGILVKDEKRFHAYVLMPASCRLQPLPSMITKDDSVTPWFATSLLRHQFQQAIDAKSSGHLDWSKEHLFFIDPHSYVVMHFLGTQPPTGWLQDFKLLLKVAQHA